MKFKATAWVRDPQGGREDSPDGRFVLTPGHGLRYRLTDTKTDIETEWNTIAKVRGEVQRILGAAVHEPLDPEVEAELVDWLTQFDPVPSTEGDSK